MKIAQAKRRLFLGEAWTAGDYVITREDGEPLHPDRLSKVFGKLVKALDLPEISLHGLRYTAASVEIDAGVDMEIVSKRRGHSDVRMTSGVYSHLVGDADAKAAERAETHIFGESA